MFKKMAHNKKIKGSSFVDNIEKFIRYNLVKYMRNYSFNLKASNIIIDFKTLNFFFELSSFLSVHFADASPELLSLKKSLEKLKIDYAILVDGLDDISQVMARNELDENDIENLNQAPIGKKSKLKSFIKNKIVNQEIASSFLNELNHISSSFLDESKEEVPERLLEIIDLFQLDNYEIELLKVIYIAERCEMINEHVFHCEDLRFLKQSHDLETVYSSRTIRRQHTRIELVTNVPVDIVRTSFKENSKLFMAGLIENERDPNLSSFLIDYLEGISKEHLFSNIFEVVNTEEAFPLTTNQVSMKELDLIQKMLSSKIGLSILLKGKPGTGKTELVKSIAKKIGLPLFNLHHSRKKTDKNIPPRKMALYLIQQLYGQKEAIFLVDECEDLINSLPSFRFFRGKNDDSNLKSFINEYLDENKCKFFFIANNTDDVDESTLRRFNYILTFNDVSVEHREALLMNLFKKENADFLSIEDLKSLASNCKLNIGHFGLALATAKNLEVEKTIKKEYFLDIINNHSKEFLGNSLKLKKINKTYCLEGLNADHDLSTISKQLSRFYQKMLDSDIDTSVNILLSGPPGTGKTEYAKYLAMELKSGFIFKQASDLKSMYVGGTEKNIKNAFLEAQSTNSILFIDEIDAFLHSRDNAHRSWEISEVNEFLVCLENFRGVFICATNSTERMDSASLRRFLFKIQFDYLDSNGVLNFYKRFFHDLIKIDLSTELKEELVRIKCLTPSDFNSVKRKFLFELEDLTNEKIVSLLKKEVSYKKNFTRGTVGLNSNLS